jgi:hypothetical protein
MRWTIVGREASSVPTIYKSIHSIPVNIGHISRYIRHTSHQIWIDRPLPALPLPSRPPSVASAAVTVECSLPITTNAVLTVYPFSPGGNAPHGRSRLLWYTLAHTRTGIQQLSLVQMAGSLFSPGRCFPLSYSGLLRICNA